MKCAVVLVLLFTVSSAWNIGKALQDVGKTLEKAAQDTGKTLEKAAQDTGKTLDKAQRDVQAELIRARENAKDEWLRARDNVVRETTRAIDDAGKAVSNIHNDIRREVQGLVDRVEKDIGKQIQRAANELKEAAITAVLKLVPGLDAARIAATVQAIGEAVKHFSAATEEFVALTRLDLWKIDEMVWRINRITDEVSAAFHPFLNGAQAVLINMKSKIEPYANKIMNLLNNVKDAGNKIVDEKQAIERKVNELKQNVEEGKKALSTTADAFRSNVLNTARDEMAAAGRDMVTELLARLVLGI